MKKTLAIILALTMVICMFAGCAAKTQTAPAENPTPSTEVEQKVAGQPAAEQPATEEAAEKTYTFGISMPQLDNDGFKANLVGIQQFAEKNNITLEVTDGKNTVDTQMQNIEDLIIKGVDAIVMCPVDSGALAAAVKKAVDAGIPVVSFDRNVSGDVLTGLAESDNVAHGSAAADLMAEVAEKSGIDVGNLVVLELLGTQSATAGLERHQGFSSRAEELGIQIVASLPTEFKNDNAYNAVLDAFQAHPDINAIFVPSDNACYSGTESALSQLGKLFKVGEEGHILITSVDGGPTGLQGVRDGYVDAIAAQSKLVMSEEAMALALKAVSGEMITENVIRIQPTKVTSENVDDPTLWANAITLK